ncbi:hypothetical protein C2G38_2186181 [Gigaspora rosea]|uniref:Uncharacterized protein n=1 Tax=Gigaspora rosea TaxID=44941 RepID=A0A397V879_9GLOM|nr:hypothetical protein C2G38_2186181 [Gigaspora rosea]
MSSKTLILTAKYPNLVFNSEDFTSHKENALVSLISRDDLQMEEIKIGIINFMALKTTLQTDCLLSDTFKFLVTMLQIVYCHIQNFFDENIWNVLIKKFMTPNYQISSTILPPRSDNIEKILGGHNPIAWNSSVHNYVYCQESFIFN